MNNYVVIEGDRYDFKDISKITEDCCSVCALKNFCDIEDCPCSVFNACAEIYPHSPQYAFVKHVKTSNNGKEIIKNKVMTQEELTNVFKYIVKKCDMLINNDHYEADAYTQDTVEDIAELCNHILDGDYGKLVEVKEKDKNAIAKTLEPQERDSEEIIYTSSCEWCNRDSCEDCYDEDD